VKLNQVIAVEKGAKNRVKDVLTTLYKAFQKPGLFEGFIKVYKKRNEADEDVPTQRAQVQANAEEALREVADEWASLMDTVAQKDAGNLVAKADVVDEDGKTILEGVPATTLLFIEKQLTDIHTLVQSAPTLDPAEVWSKDSTTKLFRTQPSETVRTKKVQKPIVLYDATDKHPAQTQLITEDENVGIWEHTRFSGALPESEKRQLLRRIVTLQVAVKKAREEANGVQTPKVALGDKVFHYIFG
jgi:hypothetical protein